MSISRSQFCVNLLSEFFKPGGPINTKTQLVSDTNRPLVNAFITRGFRINDTGSVEVELKGINFFNGENLFSQDCFEFNCFTEEGIEDAYVNIGTDICKVQTSSGNIYMTPEQRQLTGNTCFVDGFGKKRYFIRGTSDIFNYVYSVDIGIVNPISGNFTVFESNVPFYSSNIPGSLFAKTIKRLPTGIKAARIKRISSTFEEVIGIVYGELEEEFYFPHSLLKTNRSYTASEQTINLEDLSINLLLMSSFKRFELKSNQIIYRNINYSSPEIENVVSQSGSTLLNLINNFVGPQRGSVPKTISSYIKSESQYNNIADPLYENRELNCFDVNCFQLDCFEEIINNSLIKRDIDNRSIAWLSQFLVSYAINYNQDISLSFTKLIDYLLRQKNPDNKLFYKGWNQKTEECIELATEDLADIQTEKEEDLCIEGLDPEDASVFYNSSLNLDTEVLTSTNVAIFMALLKAFEYTQNFSYLIEADELYNSINKYLVNSNNLYKHSLTETNSSIESTSYQLIISLITEEYSSLNELISFFKARLFAPPEKQLENVLVGNDTVLVGSDIVTIIEQESQSSDSDNILFTTTQYDSISSSEDIFKYNYLVYSSFKYLNNKISIPFLNIIEEKYKIIESSVVDNRINTSLVFAIGCLIDNDSFLGFPNISFNSLLDFNNYRFQKEYIFNNMLLNTPKGYNWFNPEALRKGSHVGAMLYSSAKVLAKTNAEYEHLKKSLSIDELYGVLLNTKAEDYNLTRLIKETDFSLRNRIKNEIFNRGISKDNIANKLRLFNTEVSIKDNFPAMLSYETLEDPLFSSSWGEAYLQGGDTYNTNIVTLNFAQPVESDVYNEIQRMKPAGIKLEIVEVYTFSVASNIDSGTFVTFTDINGGCDNLDLETGDDILLETEGRICLEDEETVLTPVVLEPVVLPPLDDPIIEEDPNSCDCESLRGYITINGIVTELRNMRRVSLSSPPVYDVNISNGDLEPCDLAIKSVIQNTSQEYLQVSPLPIPVELLVGPAPVGIEHIIASVETNQLFTFVVYSQGGQQQSSNIIALWIEGPAGNTSILMPFNNPNFEVVSTNNYLLVYVSNGTLYSINKATLAITNINFTPAAGIITGRKLVSLDSTTIGAYTMSSNDNIIYTNIWTEGSTSAADGSSISLGEDYDIRYFNTSGGIKRYTETPSGNFIYNTPNFDELGFIESELSTAVTPDNIISYENKNYFISQANGNPTQNLTVYQNNKDILRRHSNSTALTTITYFGGPFSYTTRSSANIIPYSNYYFVPGTNNAFDFKANKTSAINSLRCPSDALSLPTGFVIQAIGSTPDGAIVTLVNEISGEWQRYILTSVNKEC